MISVFARILVFCCLGLALLGRTFAAPRAELSLRARKYVESHPTQ